MTNPRILSLGSIYLDINGKLPFTAAGLTAETETVGGTYSTELGGSAVISAKIAASLEMKPIFIGKVGQDHPAGILKQLFAESGITPALIEDAGVQTNLGINFFNDHKQTIMTVLGTANQSLSGVEVAEEVSKRLPDLDYLYLGGYFKLKKLQPLYPELIAQAKQNNVAVVLDHGRVNDSVTQEEKALLRQLIPAVQLYLPSEDEFLAVWKTDSVESGLYAVAQHAPSTRVVVKQSTRGATTSENGKILNVPVCPVVLKHTVGAGDSYNAGFIRAQSLYTTVEEQLQFASAVAALKISEATLPTIAAAQKLMSVNYTT